MLQEVARNADHTPFSLTRRTRNDLDQRYTGRTARPCELAPPQFTLPALFNAFVCHAQFVPPASPGSALHWSSYSFAAHSPKVLLSQPRLFPQSVHRTASRFHRSLLSPYYQTTPEVNIVHLESRPFQIRWEAHTQDWNEGAW